MDYETFLARKSARAPERGIANIPQLAQHLKPFQAHCVAFALRAGSSGVFLDTGLGKTLIQLEWATRCLPQSNGRALILTPLAVARQIEQEAARFGYDARVVRDQADVRAGISIVNYDRLDRIDPATFGIVALDEASILKSFSGKTTQRLIAAFDQHRWRMCATATPAPNDHMELGNHAEFLGVMRTAEMLSRFFINDTGEASQQWRLKRHAEAAFWDWMSSWARMAEMPSDLGDDDAGFRLPDLRVHRHRSRDSAVDRDLADLFGVVTMSATTMHDVKRQTAAARAETVAGIIGIEPSESWVIWCDTDYEADALRAAIPDAVEVRGSQPIEIKEERLAAFASGAARILIAKPSMCGFGLNWQHCARMVFCGRSYSYETWYQAVRRCWRFGQTRDVDVHIVVAEGEAEIGRVIERKAGDHAGMKRAMRAAMARDAGRESRRKIGYDPSFIGRLPAWMSAA